MVLRWSKAIRDLSNHGLQNNLNSGKHLFYLYKNHSVLTGKPQVLSNSISMGNSAFDVHWMSKDMTSIVGTHRGSHMKSFSASMSSLSRFNKCYGETPLFPRFARSLTSTSASKSSGQRPPQQNRKDISTVDDPFDSPTYHIPEKPVTFTEGASYSLVILAGLGLATTAGYAVFKELIFEPKEYKIFGKALERVQNDSQVKVRIGSPITGYGQESRNRAARQRIPNKTWTDEDGIERVEVNFYIRGPHGGGKVFSEMFKDKVDKKWKFTYLIVEIAKPTPVQLMLESYVPGLTAA